MNPNAPDQEAVEAHVAGYRRDGFTVARGLFDADEVEAFNQRFLDYVSGAREPVGQMKIMRDVMVVKGIVNPATPVHAVNKLICFEDDARLFRYAQHAGLQRIVRALLDIAAADVAAWTLSTNVFNKPPFVDGRHPMHQDLRYFRIRPAERIVGTWTALMPADRRNGCLAVLPGTHRGELLDHDLPEWEHVNHAFYGAKNVDATNRVYVELEPGDTLIFHPLLIHGSGQNRSENFRRAASAHFTRADAIAPGRDWRDNPNAREIPAAGALTR